MGRVIVSSAKFRRAYHRLPGAERQLIDYALRQLATYLDTRHASVGLGIKKLAAGVFEVRAGLSLRIVYVEEGPRVVLALLGNHDEVHRFLKRQ